MDKQLAGNRLSPQELLRRAGLAVEQQPRSLAGGSMGQVWQLGNYVVKTHPAAPAQLFSAEKRGLEELAATGVRTPQVYWAGPEGIIMSYLPPGPSSWSELAIMLARLHKAQRQQYETTGPTFIGSLALAQGNDHNWQRYWTEKRLLPLIEQTSNLLGELMIPLRKFVLTYNWPAEAPVLIHGDLWNGNVLMSAGGPALIDPSSWVGERAVDLAMMRLFGGFPDEFWQVYDEIFPIPTEVEDALVAYQIYFLLIHIYFFGTSYLPPLYRILKSYKVTLR